MNTNINLNEDKTRKEKKTKESRTVETFFRNALRANLDLTSLVDSKASILISVNGFILTVLVTAAGVYLKNTEMVYPFISIIITALLSIFLATLAIYPRSKEQLTKNEFTKEFESVLYFQDMSKMYSADYVNKVKAILTDKEETYAHIIKHFHILGTEISVKYTWLKRAYAVFIIGLLIGSCLTIFSMIKIKDHSKSINTLQMIYEPSGATQLNNGNVLLVEDESSNSIHIVEPQSDNTLKDVGVPRMSKKTKKLFRKNIRDLEGLTNDRKGHIFAITSYSTNKSHKRKKARENLVRFEYHNGKIEHVMLYHTLLHDLSLLHPTFKKAIDDEKSISRKKQINIEALTYDKKRDSLLIGFRAPLINKKSAIAVLKNPNRIFDRGEKAHFSDLILLDLQGKGIRGMAWDEKKQGYWITAGNVGSRKHQGFELWFWDPKSKKLIKEKIESNLGYAEAISILKDGRLLLVNDDGSIGIKGATYRFIDTTKKTMLKESK